MDKILSLFEVFAYIMAMIGGVGYCLYCQAWVIAAAVFVLGCMALPKFKECMRDLTEG